VFCESNGHWAQHCKALTDVKERIEKLKSANRCFLCLNRGHHTHACSKRGKVFCSKCKKEHHRSVCMDKETTTSRASPITLASVGRVDTSSPDFTYLQTARVWVTGPTGLGRLMRCVLDGGSQCSFIARSLTDDLKLEVIDQWDLSVTAFETTTAPGRRRFVRFNMRGTETKASTLLTALELEAARSYWIQAVQGEYFAAEFQALQENMPLSDGSKIARFNPLLDKGFIRLGGRLHFAKLSREQCHPLLLDRRHNFTKLLIVQTHSRLHHLGVSIILAEL